jgi:hypothetical protein
MPTRSDAEVPEVATLLKWWTKVSRMKGRVDDGKRE